MAFFTAFCESSARVNATSEALTRKSICLPIFPSLLTVSSSRGYAYFGGCLRCFFLTRFTVSSIALARSGAVRIRSSPKLVTKLVLTCAPFAYSMVEFVTIMRAPLRDVLEKIVRYGANKKKGIWLSR